MGRPFVANISENGDTTKQLLARSRYLLFKSQDKWTPKQVHRAEILFNRYPKLETAYRLTRELSTIYRQTDLKGVGFSKLAKWYDKGGNPDLGPSIQFQEQYKTTTDNSQLL